MLTRVWWEIWISYSNIDDLHFRVDKPENANIKVS